MIACLAETEDILVNISHFLTTPEIIRLGSTSHYFKIECERLMPAWRRAFVRMNGDVIRGKQSPLHYYDMFMFLGDHMLRATTLHFAAIYGDLLLCRQIVQNNDYDCILNANISFEVSKDEDSWLDRADEYFGLITPLRLAMAFKQNHVTNYLCSIGCDPGFTIALDTPDISRHLRMYDRKKARACIKEAVKLLRSDSKNSCLTNKDGTHIYLKRDLFGSTLHALFMNGYDPLVNGEPTCTFLSNNRP